MSFLLARDACLSCHSRQPRSRQLAPATTPVTAAARHQQHQQRRQRRRPSLLSPHAAATNEPAVPENVDLSDPELQRQIDALLQELDPELLMDDTGALISAAVAAATQQQQDMAAAAAAPGGQQQQQQQQQGSEMGPAFQRAPAAAAWQEDEGSEGSEGGLPEGVVLTRAEYRRKAAILVELMAAQRSSEGGTASDAFLQQLAAFRGEVDEALLHMVGRRLEVATQHEEDPAAVGLLQQLQAALTLEYERAQATPAMRLLDEVLDMLGDDPSLPGGRERTEAVINRLKAAFTGGASEALDVFAAAAALAEDKALAADVLSVEFVPQPLFLSEGSQLLQQAKEEMDELAQVVTSAQAELQQIRNTQPQLLESSDAQQQVQQLEHADEVLQQRKAAVAQLALVMELATDLDAALANLDVRQQQGPGAGADALLSDAEQLARMLGVDDEEE